MINGDVTMIDLSTIDGFDHTNEGIEWRKLVYAALARLRVAAVECPYFVAEKLLMALVGKGLQDLHFESLNGPWTIESRYSAVMYCTDGVKRK
jgi:hypothetical protein